MKKLVLTLVMNIFVLSCTQNTNVNKPIIKKEDVKISEIPKSSDGNKIVFEGKTFKNGEKIPDNLIRNEFYKSFALNEVYAYDINTKVTVNGKKITNKTDIFSLKAITKTNEYITFEITEYDYFYNKKSDIKPYTKTIKIKDSNSNTIIDFIGLKNASIYQDIDAKNLSFKSEISYTLDKLEKTKSMFFNNTYLMKFFSFSAVVNFDPFQIPILGNIVTDMEKGIYINLNFEIPSIIENNSEKVNYEIIRDYPAEAYILNNDNKDKINGIRITPIYK